MPFYKWNIAFSPLVQFACPTLEDARAIAEEAWTEYVEMKKDWIGEAETSEFVKLFESFQLLVPDFFSHVAVRARRSVRRAARTACQTYVNHTMNRICLGI